MEPFADTADLKVSHPTLSTAAAGRALEKASAAIRAWCGWSISRETVTKRLDGTGERSLWLRTLQLTDVVELTVTGVPLVPLVDYDWTLYGRVLHRSRWPDTPRSVEITYTHGFDPVPLELVEACLELAGKAVANPYGAVGLTRTAGPYTETASYARSLPNESAASLGCSVDLGQYRIEDVR